MKHFFKKIGIFLIAIVSLFALAALGINGWEEYERQTWEPTLPFLGLSPSMSRSDVYFIKGQPKCTKDFKLCLWGKADNFLSVNFVDEKVSIITKENPYGYSSPFYNVEQMYEVIGEEDILSISQDLLTRRYTYLKWRITFEFKENSLKEVMIGDVRWRQSRGGQYFVKGRKICPSEDCPFDIEGNIKPEYKDKDYSVFLK